jgi:hypothetical protein
VQQLGNAINDRLTGVVSSSQHACKKNLIVYTLLKKVIFCRENMRIPPQNPGLFFQNSAFQQLVKPAHPR